MFNKRKKLEFLLLPLFILITFSGCDVLLSKSGPIPIAYSKTVLCLSWDDDTVEVDGLPGSVASYRLYYRDYGSSEWGFVGESEVPENRIFLNYEDFGSGNYEFAIQSVDFSGIAGTLHESTDFSAWPPGGWYLKWMKE